MCLDGKKKRVIVHSKKNGDIPRVNVVITQQGENTLYRLTALLYDHSLRVAVPSPRGKTGGRERLRKPDTNRVM